MWLYIRFNHSYSEETNVTGFRGILSAKSKTIERLHLALAVCIQWLGLSLIVGRVWRIDSSDAFRSKCHGLDSHSSHHVGTLGKSFTHSCLWRFGVKLWQYPCCVGSTSK